MNWIVKTYKLAGSIKFFRNLGSKFRSEKLLNAIRFFNYYNEENLLISSEDVGAGTILTFLITFIVSNITLIYFNLYFSLLFSFIISLILSRKIYSFILNNYQFQYLNSLQFLDLMYQDFLIIISSTQSIFDAIQFIANSNYPVISRNFKDMIKKINSGHSPERLLLKYINTINNDTFKTRLLDIISYNSRINDVNYKNQEFSLELTSKYQEYTKQLDTRITILISINIFLPILTITLFSFYISINNFLIIILLPFHVFLLLILKKTLLKKDFFILGEKDLSSNEFNELIQFLSIFANNLQMNNSPEISLLKSMKKYNGSIKNNLNTLSTNLLMKDMHLDEAWRTLIYNMESTQSKVLLNLIKRMLKKSSYETGIRLKNIIKNIYLNKRIIDERSILLKSQQFKVVILLFILSGLMGLMTNIIPIFGQLFQIINNGNFTEILFPQYNFLNILPVLFTFSSILFITSKVITKVIRLNNSILYSISNLLIYLLISYFTSLFFTF